MKIITFFYLKVSNNKKMDGYLTLDNNNVLISLILGGGIYL